MAKDAIIISDFNLRANNRGSAALGYGSLHFLREKGFLKDGDKLFRLGFYKNPFRLSYHHNKSTIVEEGNHKWQYTIIFIFFIEKILLLKFGITLPFTTFGKLCKRLRLVAAINGGDGFSDIYGTSMFLGRLPETLVGMKLGAELILMPQTIGPFKDNSNKQLAEQILKYASKVYVRDDKFIKELEQVGVDYERTKDLSYYMKPEPWDIDILPNAIGINVSGLAYSNHFKSLTGEFNAYPELINSIITHFQSKGLPVYLIPHSYNYTTPDTDNDDLVACKEAYGKLSNRDNVFLIDKDLISPQIKYVISRMSFFIGTRMHANFAAIFTHVPVYGLSYSYKFEGAFKANGISGQLSNICNIKKDDIKRIVNDIDRAYTKLVANSSKNNKGIL